MAKPKPKPARRVTAQTPAGAARAQGAGPNQVALAAVTPPIRLTCLLGPTPPLLAGRYGGWQTISRPQRVASVEWQGTDPFTLALDLLLDGYQDARSVEAACAALSSLALSPGGFQAPPSVGVWLPSLALPDTTWVIDTLEWGDNVVRAADQHGQVVRLRQDAKLTLLQLVTASSLRKLPPTTGRGAGGPSAARVPAPGGSRGVAKLAAKFHTTTKAILKASKLRDATRVKQGQQVRLR
jgi:hypothetical protein